MSTLARATPARRDLALAKPTPWRGQTFRSRLEARYAVFFDTLGIDYTYEPQRYRLPDGSVYTPDFWLPHLTAFIELKPTVEIATAERAGERCKQLCAATGKNVYLFVGLPAAAPLSGASADDGGYVWLADGGWDNYQRWAERPRCHTVGIAFDGRADRILCGCPATHDKSLCGYSGALMAAYHNAAGALFADGVGR